MIKLRSKKAKIFIITLLNFVMMLSYAFADIDVRMFDNLVPESRMSPLSDEDIGGMLKIKTALWFSLKQSPKLFSMLADKDIQKTNHRYEMGNETIDLGFSKVSVLELKNDVSDASTRDSVVLVPCKVGSKVFGAYLFRDDYGMIRIGLYSKEEHDRFIKEFSGIKNGYGIRAGDLEKRLFFSGEHEDKEICIVKKGDAALNSVFDFLDRIGAKKLSAGLDILAKNEQILAANEEGVVSPGIMVGSNDTTDDRALSILTQLIMIVDGDIELSDFNHYRDAFTEFRKDQDKFSISKTYLNERVSYFENDLSLSEFNQYSDFMEIAGTQKFKIYNKAHSFLLDGVKRDIENIVARVQEDLVKEEKMPINSVRIDHISQAIVPAAILTVDGELIVNENFARCLWVLKEEFALDGGAGDVNIESIVLGGKDLNFNLYEALIYSFVIRHMNKALAPDRNITGNWEQEMWARGEFGEKYFYINFLGYLYYKFVLAEMEEGFWGDDIIKYLEKHPELWRKLREGNDLSGEKRIVEGVKGDLYKLRRFFEQKRYDKAPIYFERLPKEDIPTYLGVFNFLCKNNQKPWSLRELTEYFGGDLDVQGEVEKDAPVRRAMDLLEKVGAVNGFEIVDDGSARKKYNFHYVFSCIREGKKPVVKPRKYYMAAPMDGRTQRPKIRAILKEQEKKPVNIDKIKNQILDVTGENWARTFLGNLGRVIREAEIFRDGKTSKKILIGLETGWVPEGQRKAIAEIRAILRKLDLEGIVKIVEGSSLTIAGIMNEEMEKQNISPRQVLAMVSRSTVENEQFKRDMGFFPGKDDVPFLIGVDAGNLNDDSYIRIMEMLVMAVRRSFNILPISEHSNIEVVINDDGTVIFIPKAEPLEDIAQRYYTRQKKILLSA